jgi:hypothetical protein
MYHTKRVDPHMHYLTRVLIQPPTFHQANSKHKERAESLDFR